MSLGRCGCFLLDLPHRSNQATRIPIQPIPMKNKPNNPIMKKLLATTILFATSAISAISQTTNPTNDAGDKDAVAVVLGKEIKTEEKGRLSGLIFGALLDQYAKENKIEPTEDEIKVFLDKQEEMSMNSLLESEREKSRLVKELKSQSLTVEQRKEKQSELEMAEEALRTQRETREGAQQMEKQLQPMLRKMALQQVRTWKINQALFKKYGGRVIFQQAGVEPLDAYREFLEDQQKKGAFRIMDKAAEASFWKYFTNDAMHTFLSKDEGEKMMEKPFWLMEKPITE